MGNPTRGLLFGVIFLLLAAAPAPAQEPAQPDSPEMTLEELMAVRVATVTTASKLTEKATAAPGTVLVIDARDIRLRGYADLKDVLRDLPGMETVENYYSELGTLVPVRGIVGNNKIVVLVNGMRVNPPGGENMPLRSDFSVRQAEQIEVIYGPGSTLYGQDAISAVINIKIRKPDENRPGELGINGGQNSTRGGWVWGGLRFGGEGEGSAAGYLQVQNSELSRLDKDYPSWWRQYAAVAEPKGSGTTPDRRDYGLNAFARVERGGASFQIWRRTSKRSSSESILPTFGFVEQARWGDTSTVLEGRHTAPLSPRARLDSILSYNRYEIDPSSRYVFQASPTQWFLNDFKYGIGTGLTLEETLSADLGPTLSLIAGLAASTFDIIPKSTIPGGADPDGDIVSQGGSFVYYTEAGNPASRREIPRAVRTKYQNYGAYVELGWQASPALKTIVGARVDRDTRFDETPFLPRLAAIYAVTPELTAKYTFTRAYISPAPYFSFATFDNGTLLNTTNPDLEPETATSHEINLTYARSNLSLGLSLYRGAQKNLIHFPTLGLPQSIVQDVVFLDEAGTQRRALVRAVNGGSSRNQGVDLFGRATFGRANVWFSYSYVHFKEDRNGSELGLDGISAQNLRLGSTLAPAPRLFLTPSLTLRSTPANIGAGALERELKTPWEANLYLLYSADENMELFADLRNITNHKYALRGSRGLAVPQETFRGVMGVRYAF